MKRYIPIVSSLLLTVSLQAQTMFIDYTERTGENSAAIHVMEARRSIETEEFNDIIEAKTKLIRIIENYRTDGYNVQATNVSTHRHKRAYHYHYQYILQKEGTMEPVRVNKSGNNPHNLPPPPRNRNRGKNSGQQSQPGSMSHPPSTPSGGGAAAKTPSSPKGEEAAPQQRMEQKRSGNSQNQAQKKSSPSPGGVKLDKKQEVKPNK